jgi:HEAT repeat protein
MLRYRRKIPGSFGDHFGRSADGGVAVGGGDGGILSGNPEELLRSALEKIVFFECRVEQLESELSASRTVAQRARGEASGSRTREVELEHALAEARGERATLSSQNAELAERVRLLETERERLLSSMVEQSRVSGARPAGEDEDANQGPDLAGFISELRGEIDRLRSWKAAAEAAGTRVDAELTVNVPELSGRPAQPVPEVGIRFGEEGRLGVRHEDAAHMKELFTTRSERALYESAMRDLASADRESRRRAASCLQALGSKAAAPILAAALGRERDPEVKSELLGVLSALEVHGAAELALRELTDASPQVRSAALEALARLQGAASEPRLAGALGDPSPLVRRRAALLLGFRQGETADEALASALSDRDPGVARTAAVALSGRPSALAQRALARALDHREASVRRAAARAVSRWAGEPIDCAASSTDRRRASRRIVEKLTQLGPEALRESLFARASAAPARAESRPAAPVLERPVVKMIRPTPPAPPVQAPAARQAPAAQVAPSVRAAVAVAEALPAGMSSFEETIVGEVRAALRGRSADELTTLLSTSDAAVEQALRALVERGELTQRGARFYMR